MLVCARLHERVNVEAGGVAFEDAVGEEEHSVTRLKRQKLYAELAIPHDLERRVGVQLQG